MELKEVFEPVVNFVKGFQKKDKEPASKQAAKDRLKLVLMQDRASVSPDFFEIMKKELIDAIKKYIEIDEEALEEQLAKGMEAGLESASLQANYGTNLVNEEVNGDASYNSTTLETVETETSGEVINEEGVAEDIVPQTSTMTEMQADKMAEEILSHIENVAAASNVDECKKDEVEEATQKDEKQDENIEEIKENSDDSEEKPKATRKRTTRKKTAKSV